MRTREIDVLTQVAKGMSNQPVDLAVATCAGTGDMRAGTGDMRAGDGDMRIELGASGLTARISGAGH